MKPKILIAVLILSFSTLGSDCINDPFLVAVNLDLIEGVFSVNPGDGSFNDQSGVINIRNLIDSNFRDDIRGFRLYDIRVRVQGPYPAGTVSGDCYYSLDGGPERQFLSFAGAYSAYAAGVSLLNPGTPPLVTRNAANLALLLAALNDINNLPGTIQLRGAGTGPAVTQTLQVVVEVYLQADAEVN